MDSNGANVGFRRVPEGLGIRGHHRQLLNASKGRTARDYRNDNGAGEMTIKMLIASMVLAVAAHAVLPEIAAKPTDCAPVIECTQKELIE